MVYANTGSMDFVVSKGTASQKPAPLPVSHKTGKKTGKKPVSKSLKRSFASGSEFTLDCQMTADRLPPYVREYQFHPTRKFRADFAFVPQKLLVEVEGGLFVKGAHSNPLGIIRDMEKSNLAALGGWALLRYSPAQIKSGEAIAQIKQWFANREEH